MNENHKIELTRAECYRKLKKNLWLNLEIWIFLAVPIALVLTLLTISSPLVGVWGIILGVLGAVSAGEYARERF